MTRRLQPRFPFGPLEAQARAALDGPVDTKRIAAYLGTATRAVNRYRAEGVPAWSADRIATHIDRHPAELWPQYADWFPTAIDRKAANAAQHRAARARKRAARERAADAP